MASPPRTALPDWDLYRALREQWTHEDNLVNHRLMWLILSQGLLFTELCQCDIARPGVLSHLRPLRLTVADEDEAMDCRNCSDLFGQIARWAHRVKGTQAATAPQAIFCS